MAVIEKTVKCSNAECDEVGQSKVVRVSSNAAHWTGAPADVKVQGTLICTSCGGELDVFGIGD